MNAERFSEAIGELGDKYYAEAAAYQPHRKKRSVRWIAAAACICLLIGSAAALAASGLGTRLIEAFSSRAESGFDLSAAVERIPVSELSEEIRQAGDIIKQQFAEQKPYSNRCPGLWQADFASHDEVCGFIGLDQIKAPGDWRELPTTLNVYGGKTGEIQELELETARSAGDIRMQLFTRIYTENHDAEIVITSRAAEKVDFTESSFTAKNGVSCHVIEFSALESGCLCTDGYIVDDGILYDLHIAYPEKDAARADRLLHEWAEQF